MSRRLLKGPQYSEITNPSVAERFDEAQSSAAEFLIYGSRHHVAAPSRTL